MGVSEDLDFDDALFISDSGERGLIHRNMIYPDGERVGLKILNMNSIDVDEKSLRSDHLSLLNFAIVPLRKSRV